MYNLWLLDLRDRGTHYDILILFADAEGPLSLPSPADDPPQAGRTLEKGDVFLLLSSPEPIDGILEEAAERTGTGCAGPFLTPDGAGSFSVRRTVSFRR